MIKAQKSPARTLTGATLPYNSYFNALHGFAQEENQE